LSNNTRTGSRSSLPTVASIDSMSYQSGDEDRYNNGESSGNSRQGSRPHSGVLDREIDGICNTLKQEFPEFDKDIILEVLESFQLKFDNVPELTNHARKSILEMSINDGSVGVSGPDFTQSLLTFIEQGSGTSAFHSSFSGQCPSSYYPTQSPRGSPQERRGVTFPNSITTTPTPSFFNRTETESCGPNPNPYMDPQLEDEGYQIISKHENNIQKLTDHTTSFTQRAKSTRDANEQLTNDMKLMLHNEETDSALKHYLECLNQEWNLKEEIRDLESSLPVRSSSTDSDSSS